MKREDYIQKLRVKIEELLVKEKQATQQTRYALRELLNILAEENKSDSPIIPPPIN